MTSAEIRAKIKTYEKKIDDYNAKIKQLEDDQSEFRALITKYEALQSDFESHQRKRKSALSVLPSAFNLRCIAKYYDGMDNLLNSVEYTRADNGLTTATEKIQKKQRSADNEINHYKSSILSCKEAISRLRQQLQMALVAESAI